MSYWQRQQQKQRKAKLIKNIKIIIWLGILVALYLAVSRIDFINEIVR